MNFGCLNGEFFVKCASNGYYLDGGPEHIWKNSIQSNPDSNYIKWKFLQNNDGTFYIRCVRNGFYLDGGPDHTWKNSIESNPNRNYIKWQII